MRKIDVFSFTISNENFSNWNPYDRRLFLLCGFVLNEINVLARCFIWTGFTDVPPQDDKSAQKIIEHGQAILGLTFVRLLAGKLYEAWEMTKKTFWNNERSSIYLSKKNEKLAKSSKRLKSYFGRTNNIQQMRNTVGFHYDPNNISLDFDEISKNEPFEFHLAFQNLNAAYYGSEAAIFGKFLDAIGCDSTEDAYNTVMDELLDVLRDIQTLFSEIMATSYAINCDEEIRSRNLSKSEICVPTGLRDIALPYFVEPPSSGSLSS